MQTQNLNNKMYPKWVGVILGFLLNGSAHYFAGDKTGAIKWYFAITLTAIAGSLILALPGILSFAISASLMLVSIALLLIMLKQSYRPVRRIRVWEWVVVIALNFLFDSGWNYGIDQVVRTCKVPTESMAPAIMSGDRVVAERITYRFKKPKRGDIIMFSTSGISNPLVRPDTFYIKRIAGLPGETIEINPPNLIVNGNVVHEPPIFAEIASRSNGFLCAHTVTPKPVLSSREDKIILGDNEYLTLGDNTARNLDGRYYGSIKGDQIIGRISRIYWPLSRIEK